MEREQQNFPRSYVQSTHRQDFFERFIADNETETTSINEQPNKGEDSEETSKPSTSSWVDQEVCYC